ncbi:MAG: SpoIID/LytB domain-containing protein, partial [Nitrospirae bacterium]|nr:SpoIID/LytB domain-containing protein [Nitrospirota bacterium]
ENYVKSVVMSELSDDWSFEALKTQAVIARTYAVNHILTKPNSLYHLTSSTDNQMYKGGQGSAMVSRAVDITAGEVLTYDGKVIVAYYHSTSSGKTEIPDEVFHKHYPYLKSVKSDDSLSPMSSWTREIPYSDFEAAVNIKDVYQVTIYSHTLTGRVRSLKISGSDKDAIIETKDLRKLLGWKTLPSTMFKIEETSDKGITLKGSGYGHGVGLSQWGALKMSRDGENYRKILSHYYPGTTIKLYDDL